MTSYEEQIEDFRDLIEFSETPSNQTLPSLELAEVIQVITNPIERELILAPDSVDQFPSNNVQDPTNFGGASSPVIIIGQDSSPPIIRMDQNFAHQLDAFCSLFFGRKRDNERSLLLAVTNNQLKEENRLLHEKSQLLITKMQGLVAEIKNLKENQVVLIPDALGIQFLQNCQTAIQLNKKDGSAKIILSSLPEPSNNGAKEPVTGPSSGLSVVPSKHPADHLKKNYKSTKVEMKDLPNKSNVRTKEQIKQPSSSRLIVSSKQTTTQNKSFNTKLPEPKKPIPGPSNKHNRVPSKASVTQIKKKSKTTKGTLKNLPKKSTNVRKSANTGKSILHSASKLKTIKPKDHGTNAIFEQYFPHNSVYELISSEDEDSPFTV